MCRRFKDTSLKGMSCMQPDIAGMDSFPGRQLHCHNFRHNKPFRDQRVLVVGASFSGEFCRSLLIEQCAVCCRYIRPKGILLSCVRGDYQLLIILLMQCTGTSGKSSVAPSTLEASWAFLQGVQSVTATQALNWQSRLLMWQARSSTARAPGPTLTSASKCGLTWSAFPC